MGKHNFLKKAAIATLIVAPLLITAPTLAPTAHAYETNPNGYEVPDLSGIGASIVDERVDEQTGLVYKVEGFKDLKGQIVLRLSRNELVFSYVIDEDGDGKIDYSIVDEDGNGSFETKYFPGEVYAIPEWAI